MIARLTWKQPSNLVRHGRARTLAEAARNIRPIGSYLDPVCLPTNSSTRLPTSPNEVIITDNQQVYEITSTDSNWRGNSTPNSDITDSDRTASPLIILNADIGSALSEMPDKCYESPSEMDNSEDAPEGDTNLISASHVELGKPLCELEEERSVLQFELDYSEVNLGVTRKNTSRHARTVSTSEDLYDYPLLSTNEELPGRIPTKLAKKLIKKGGPPIVLHPDDHPHQWIRPSHFCPNGGYGLIIRIDAPGNQRTGIIGIYDGTSNEDLHLSHSEAAELWADSDYVLSSPSHNFIVNGDLSSGAARINEGFETTNSFWYFNKERSRFEARFKGKPVPGYYEVLGNYTEGGLPSSYWTERRVSQLPKATQKSVSHFIRTANKSPPTEGKERKVLRTISQILQVFINLNHIKMC